MPAHLHGIHVLIVDDDADARKLLRRVVEECGGRVTDAESVRIALEKIDQVQAQILISDIGMPGQDGLTLIRHLRAHGRSAQNLPAIALTAFARPEDRDRALQAGFQMHLSKPVDQRELVAAIENLTGSEPRSTRSG